MYGKKSRDAKHGNYNDDGRGSFCVISRILVKYNNLLCDYHGAFLLERNI